MKNFLEEIRSSVVIGDGAVGTELLKKGATTETGIERMNLLAPDLVLQLHRDYVASGSRMIETNTFGANRPNLSKYGAESDVRDVILAGVSLARNAAGSDVYVGGSVGPLPVTDGEPIGEEEQKTHFTEQIQALLDGDVDLLILETFTSLRELENAVKLACGMTKIPIVAQMAYGLDGLTSDGASASEALVRCRKAGADVVGANCGYGAHSVIEAIRRMAPHNVPMSAFMNAGFPERVEGRLVYRTSSEYLAKSALGLAKMGVRLVGGCCGTSPETIRKIKEALNDYRPAAFAAIKEPARTEGLEEERERPSAKGALDPILVELDPPSDPDLRPLIESAIKLKAAGVSSVTVADNPLSSVRTDTLSTAASIQRETGLRVTMHLTGRDRNRLALKSTIMGAHAQGIRSLLCITGDPVRMCEDPNTSGVFDLTSVGLVKLIQDFNDGCGGTDCRTDFLIGVALNPNVRSIDGQITKLLRKIEAGADFAITQPVFTKDRIDMLREALDRAGVNIPIFAGILPLTSARNAEFLHNEVPGIFIPDEIRMKISNYETVADQRAAITEILTGFVGEIASGIYGFHFITPRLRVELVSPLASAARRALGHDLELF